MNIATNIIFALMIGLFYDGTSSSDDHHEEKPTTFIDGQLLFSVKEKHLKARLSYAYLATDSARTSLSFFLTPDVKIDAVEGRNVKGHTFDARAKPFATLKIDFIDAVAKDERMNFSLAYSGKPSKGFWSEEYKWIDVDPDFMILPLFTTLENFTYQINASVDDKTFTFYDLDKGRVTEDLFFSSLTPSYYFNPILASNNKANGMGANKVMANTYNINVFSNKPDSASYVGNAAGRILDFFNTTFGAEDKVSSFSVLYRPLPYSIHKITRSFGHSIVFSKGHHDIATLAHEVAHFWWHRGDALTTEKWLSESFAEYSEYMFVRHDQGEDKFNEIMKNLAERSEKLPALLGNDRFSPQGDGLIYVKGPYLLNQLENKIGRDKFQEFLVELNRKKVETTTDLLMVLESISSAQVRKEFEEGLNK
ncbi:hypothetical protein DXT99_24560 [Pontibacter diazotrophicus]|uniref:Peptidase M1 membrane alanine aminopeptidase domain-containing protein n=1 Tax=Pontibacter diazotrophicus TaxID=1400979 RepID=A0A3D8L2Q5_9BACT|nr:M1 family aminopeptidase [Pontibacter diazotrophicus]RDV11507.1 hypothetical protein DXT99_24560 [Pontibacter diazotrophicus]